MNFSQYAKHRGWQPIRVTKAVQEGKLTVHLDDQGKRYIISELADEEIARNTDPSKVRESATGKADALDTLQRVNEELGETVRGNGVGDSGEDPGVKRPMNLTQAKTQNEYYKAELARLKYEEEQGKLISADVVKEEAFKLGRFVRDAMLALPDRVASEFAAEGNAFTIHQRLGEEIRRALQGLKVEDDGKT